MRFESYKDKLILSLNHRSSVPICLKQFLFLVALSLSLAICHHRSNPLDPAFFTLPSLRILLALCFLLSWSTFLAQPLFLVLEPEQLHNGVGVVVATLCASIAAWSRF